jgi:iron complex transport system substrate-binding protein
MRSHRLTAVLLTAVLLTAAVLVSGCGAGSGPAERPVVAPVDVTLGGAPTPTRYPLTIQNCGHPVTFTGPPRRVVVLSGGSVAEAQSLLLLDLGDRVIVNAQRYGASDAPGLSERVAALPTAGLPSRGLGQSADPSAEQVLAARPDLVLSGWSGGFDPAAGFAGRDELARIGANTLVNPVNCAMGNPRATPEEQAAYQGASPKSSLEFLLLLGQVFDVSERAHAVARGLADRIAATNAKVAGTDAARIVVTYPEMSTGSDVPAVLAGGTYDRVLAAAGGVSSFPPASRTFTRTIGAEQLAAADVDLLVIGAISPREDLPAIAERLFAAYPQWAASRRRAWVGVSDGMFLGPTNAWAIEKIAKAAHPDRF